MIIQRRGSTDRRGQSICCDLASPCKIAVARPHRSVRAIGMQLLLVQQKYATLNMDIIVVDALLHQHHNLPISVVSISIPWLKQFLDFELPEVLRTFDGYQRKNGRIVIFYYARIYSSSAFISYCPNERRTVFKN